MGASRITTRPGEASSNHTIPVIDRMMEVLEELKHRPAGQTVRQLTETLKQPRTTIYRILNTLRRHEMVRRDDAGSYHLGIRLLHLASRAASNATDFDLASLSQPFLDKLAAELGEGVKLSVRDAEGVMVLAAARGRREYSLMVTPGQRLPIHAGAASKVLLAHLPAAEIEVWLSQPLLAYTPKTIADPKRLRSELLRIKRLGWAHDKGENALSIHAFAAPVARLTGAVIAALSVPFLAGTEPSRTEEIRMRTIKTALDISAALPE